MHSCSEKLMDADDAVDGMGIACRGAKDENEILPRMQVWCVVFPGKVGCLKVDKKGLSG